MSFSFSTTKDGDRFVEVTVIHDNSGAIPATKIIDASTLNYTDGNGNELLNLVSVFVTADVNQRLNFQLYWADSAGLITATPATIIGNNLSGKHAYFVPNNYPNSNGDVYFTSGNNHSTVVLTFQKVRGFYSSRAKPWSP